MHHSISRIRPRPSRRSWQGVIAALVTFSIATLAYADSVASAAGPDPQNLQPPLITVLQSKPGLERGFIFVAPKTTPAPNLQQGPEIIDNQGRPVWFHAAGLGNQAADFRIQTYRGESVLTWWEGQSHTGPGHGEGIDYIFDRTYNLVATVNAGHGYAADTHEFRLTHYGTALITVYSQVKHDLSSVGGPADGLVFDGIVQEIDVATGAVLFEWHSLDHVGLDESHAPVPTTATTPYDYFHINAVSLDVDGNLFINSRNTWASYKVDHHSGSVIWRLGGTKTDFALGPDVAFAWQHDPEAVAGETIRLFDNEASPAVLPASRVVWIHRDPWRHTATLVRSIVHPDALSAGSQGTAQSLANGETFVGWGATGRFSEFDHDGILVFDASVPSGWDTYRAYRHSWHAHPDTQPTATAHQNGDGTVTVHAVWNGATDVARWLVSGGSRPRSLWPIGSGDWNGLDTAITLTTDTEHISVVAQNADGRLIGRSEPVAVSN